MTQTHAKEQQHCNLFDQNKQSALYEQSKSILQTMVLHYWLCSVEGGI